MIIAVGEMWDEYNEVDVFCITTNGMLTQDGKLIMGRGMAEQARDKLDGIDTVLGTAITQFTAEAKTPFYGFIIVEYKDKLIGGFQVKQRPHENARIDMIQYSSASLFAFLVQNPLFTVALNCPGVGNGNLTWEQVKPIVSLLPDNVTVWFTPSEAERLGVGR